jgi:uncharacterized protein YbjT (DUF2867 family)
MAESVVITGASGHVGGELARRLLARGRKVRVVGREAPRLQPLVELGAEPVVGSVEDRAFLTQAFAGAQAVFAMIPPNAAAHDVRAYQRRIAEAYAGALAAAGVSYAVSLSSIGADLPEGNGPIAGLHELEQKLNDVPKLATVHLRAGFFMENLLGSIPLVKGQGINGGPVAADVPLAMIATKDIAAVAAELLAPASFGGQSVRELQGPRDYTMAEATAILGRAIGKPDLAYVVFPYDAARQGLLGFGFSDSMADAFIEMARAFNERRIAARQPRSAATTTSTTLEEFGSTFAAAFRAP